MTTLDPFGCALALAAFATAPLGQDPGIARPMPTVSVTIEDSNPWHVHPPGSRFTVHARLSEPGVVPARIFAQWVDAQGQPLGSRIQVQPRTRTALTSPSGAPGYYGLGFHCDRPEIAFPPQEAGFGSDELGFAIAPQPDLTRAADPSSPFGTVHTSFRARGREWDPWLRGTHCKTLTWNSLSAKGWGPAIAERRNAGLVELPIAVGHGWVSDDDLPLDAAGLMTLESKLRQYAAVRPNESAWELGIEENEAGRFAKPYYFDNLLRKVERVRAVLGSMSLSWRLVYNLEGFDLGEYGAFFASQAAKQFDVVSIHPYKWKDFPSPETWLVDHLRKTRALLATHGLGNRELWFTEIGLPVRGNRNPNGFFGYPSLDRRVPGATRHYAAQYLVKCHALALGEGVKRLYVYNYQNRGGSIHAAEDHFGLRSYTGEARVPGFPLPSYLAYVTMLRNVADRPLALAHRPKANVFVFDFRSKDGGDDCLLAWVYPAGTQLLAWNELRAGLGRQHIAEVTSLYGTPEAHADAVRLTGQPLWVRVRGTTRSLTR